MRFRALFLLIALLLAACGAFPGRINGVARPGRRPDRRCRQPCCHVRWTPAEIADDFEILAEAYSASAAALEDAGVDFRDAGSLSSPEAQAALATAGEAIASSDVEEASNNFNEYMDEVCDN